MKLSLVFELLLIFVLLAFAASKTIGKQKNNNKKGISNSKEDNGIKVDDNGINRYCKCQEAYCNCCRDFQVPLINIDGPGCASLMYLNGDKMAVSLSFGRKVITNRTLSGKKPTPVCMPLPGGISKFCGRVYNIARAGEEFRACLGLELQSKRTVEAAVRVSCFKFGPRGVTSEAADPLPLVPQSERDEDDDDDDDDDDDNDDDDFGLTEDDDDDDDLSAVNDVGEADYTGFSLLGDDLLGDLFSSGGKKKNKNKNKKKQAPSSTTTTTKRPRPSRRPTRKPASRSTTPRPFSTTRATTIRVRPASSTRRPARRPTRRPTRRTTTTPAPISDATTTSHATNPISVAVVSLGQPQAVASTERIQISSVSFRPTEPLVIVTQKVVSTPAPTSAKPVTNFEDPGLQMSLASLAGQLSSMPVTPIIPSKESSVMSTVQDTNYEKIETITPKTMTTASFYSSSSEKDSGSQGDDNMIQIVHNLEDSSEINLMAAADESRGHRLVHKIIPGNYEGLSLLKNKGGNDYGDYDVLGLTEVGETIGENLGVFNSRRRQHKNKHANVEQGRKENNDYEDLLGISELSDSLGISRSDNNKYKKNNKHRGRQNKMMRGEWSV